MDRRRFIRVAGGGVVMGATVSGAGCSRALPPEAIAAWQGAGEQADVLRWILGYAILAPHSHNLQSWVVDLGVPDQIELRCDLNRLLPETDPLSRQIMMSHGTFLELLNLAARERGLRAEITLFAQGAFGPDKIDARPVARIRLAPDASITKDPLFAQILARRTNRSKAPAPDSFATTGQIKDFNTKIGSTPSFLWLVSSGNDRVTQVNAGRAYARVQLAATAHGVAMQPLSQALQEYPEQAGSYADIHRLLDAPVPSQTVQMWARVGFAPTVEPAPRRGVDAHIASSVPAK